MRFIDDEQYYRWLRVSFTLSIILFMLSAPGLSMQEFEFAGVKFGAAGANLLRLLVVCGAVYAILQYWLTSWMASRRATLFNAADGVGVVARARATAEAAKTQLEAISDCSAEIAKLPALAEPASVRIELGDLTFSGDAARRALSELRWLLADRARSAVQSVQPLEGASISAADLEQIGTLAASVIVEELDSRFTMRLHGFEQCVRATSSQAAQIDERLRSKVEMTSGNLERAVAMLGRLHATTFRLDLAREAKFLCLELLPASFLFGLASYHYCALFYSHWPTIFQLISP